MTSTIYEVGELKLAFVCEYYFVASYEPESAAKEPELEMVECKLDDAQDILQEMSKGRDECL